MRIKIYPDYMQSIKVRKKRGIFSGLFPFLGAIAELLFALFNLLKEY